MRSVAVVPANPPTLALIVVTVAPSSIAVLEVTASGWPLRNSSMLIGTLIVQRNQPRIGGDIAGLHDRRRYLLEHGRVDACLRGTGLHEQMVSETRLVEM